MQSNAENLRVPLLHVDDDPNDRLLVKEAIVSANTPFAFYEADSLESAIPFFQLRPAPGEIKASPLPSVVLLDYHMRAHTGVDFLYWLRVKKGMSSLPVVMFSGSLGGTHIAQCYEAGANFFLGKPTDLSRFKAIVRALYMAVRYSTPGAILRLKEYQPAVTQTKP